jgi:acyl-CoA thioesterase FadM
VDPGVVFSVVELQARYHRPARLDDQLSIGCAPVREGGASLAFSQSIWLQSDEDKPLLSASVRVACLDAHTLKPRRLPAVIAQELA